MVKKTKAPTLKDRIEKSQSDLDLDWKSHLQQVSASLQGLKPLEKFDLLTQEGAQKAIEQCNKHLKELITLQKQTKAVNSLLNQNQQIKIDDLNLQPNSKKLFE